MAFKGKKPQKDDSGFSEISRRFKERPFLFGGTVFILIIIIIAFVFVPSIPVMDRGGQMDLIFGYYNGAPISYVPGNYFSNVLYETAANQGFDPQSDYTMNFEAAYNVWYTAFIRSLMHTAVLEEMKRAAYTAPPKTIDRQLAERPEFQEDGRFSIIKFQKFDRAGLNSMRRMIEENQIAGRYIDDLMGLRVSEAEKTFINRMALPERSFEMVSFPRSAYPDSEIAVFAASKPDLFKNVHLSIITISSNEREAQQILAAVKEGTMTFEDAARNQSSDQYKDKGGDMGLRMAFEFFTEIAGEDDRNAILSLKKGELSPIVKVPGGNLAFFRVEESPYASDLSLADNIAKVRVYMERFEGGRIENWLVARAEELISRAKEGAPVSGEALFKSSLAAYIDSLPADDPAAQFIPQSLGPVGLNYGNVDLFRTIDVSSNWELFSAVSNENFWRIAFSIPLHTPSMPFTLGDSIVVLTAIDENAGDESNDYVASMYMYGWIPRALDGDLNYSFTRSKKFEDNFDKVFRSFQRSE